MKSIQFFTRFLLSTAALSSLFVSGQVLGQDAEETEAMRAKCCDSFREPSIKKKKRSNKKCVLANFRSHFSGILRSGQSFPFTIEDVNKGNGIQLVNGGTEFLIKKTGTYMINYGVSSSNLSATIDGRGISLQVTHGQLAQVRSCILVNTSQAIMLKLQAGDRLRLFAQQDVQIIFGSLFTTFCDTGYITFMQLDCCCR